MSVLVFAESWNGNFKKGTFEAMTFAHDTAKKLKSVGYEVIGFDNYNDYYEPSLKENRTKELKKHDITTKVNLKGVGKNLQDHHEVPYVVSTKKGYGYEPAEKSEDKYHGVSKFNVVTGEQVKSPSKAPSYTKVFANALVKHAQKDKNIV